MSQRKRTSRASSAQPVSAESHTTPDETTGVSLWLAAASLGAFVLLSGANPADDSEAGNAHQPRAPGLALDDGAAALEQAADESQSTPEAREHPAADDRGSEADVMRIDELELEPADEDAQGTPRYQQEQPARPRSAEQETIPRAPALPPPSPAPLPPASRPAKSSALGGGPKTAPNAPEAAPPEPRPSAQPPRAPVTPRPPPDL
jgi:hypothetical protein